MPVRGWVIDGRKINNYLGFYRRLNRKQFVFNDFTDRFIFYKFVFITYAPRYLCDESWCSSKIMNLHNPWFRINARISPSTVASLFRLCAPFRVYGFPIQTTKYDISPFVSTGHSLLARISNHQLAGEYGHDCGSECSDQNAIGIKGDSLTRQKYPELGTTRDRVISVIGISAVILLCVLAFALSIWTEDERKELARAWSTLGASYDAQSFEQVWETMPPRDGGLGYGTIYKLAVDRGFKGAPANIPAAEVFKDWAESATPASETDPWIKLFSRSAPSADENLPPITFWDAEKTTPHTAEGSIIIPYGPTGKNKTNVILADCLDAVINSGAKVVYAAGEGAHGLGKNRIPALCKARSITTADLKGKWRTVHAVPDLTSTEQVDAFIIACQPFKPDFVVLDPLSAAKGATKENSDELGSLIAANGPVGRIRRMLHCVFLIHHTGKDQDKGARGHSGLSGNADGVWKITRAQVMATIQLGQFHTLADFGTVLAMAEMHNGPERDWNAKARGVSYDQANKRYAQQLRVGCYPKGKNRKPPLDGLFDWFALDATTKKEIRFFAPKAEPAPVIEIDPSYPDLDDAEPMSHA